MPAAHLLEISGAALAMTAIVALRYLAASGGFAFLTRARAIYGPGMSRPGPSAPGAARAGVTPAVPDAAARQVET